MKMLLLIAAALISTVSAMAKDFGAGVCDCVELHRRADGINFIANNSGIDGRERHEAAAIAARGYRFLERSERTGDLNQKEIICSEGNQAVNATWVRWQPYIAQSGADEGNSCN